MKTSAIGIIDSGLGGYTIFHELKKNFPHVKFVFIADQKNSPYGDKSKEELLVIGRQLIKTFKRLHVKDVIFACNTMSSTVLDELVEENLEMNLYGIIDITVDSIPESAKKILVLATQATVSQNAYSKLITQRLKNAWVKELATPKLVPLIEGLADDVDVDEAIESYLFKKSKVDTLVLGCTHYPLVEKSLKKYTKANLVNSIQPSIELVKTFDELPKGVSRVYSSLDAKRLESQILSLFNEKEKVYHIELEEIK